MPEWLERAVNVFVGALVLVVLVRYRDKGILRRIGESRVPVQELAHGQREVERRARVHGQLKLRHCRGRAMNEVINGQIVPALGQWQGTILIIASLSLVSLLRLAYRQIIRRMIPPNVTRLRQ